MINWFRNNHSYILLIVTLVVLAITLKTHLSNVGDREQHFEDMEQFRFELSQKLTEIDSFKNKGERFTADDGRRHAEQIKQLEQRLQKTVEIIQSLENEE